MLTSDDAPFKYAPVLGGETFTTAVLNQAVAKYHETTCETAAAVQSETVGLFLKSLYVGAPTYRFYKDSYHQSGIPTGIVNLLMVSPALKYIGSEYNPLLETFADQLIENYNVDEDKIQPTDEMKQHGQITNFVLDFMKYY